MTEVVESAEQHKGTNILEVPLEADGEVVTFDLDNDLPENPSEICVLLENEKCAVEYWLAIGTAYARNNLVDNAIEVVSKGLQASSVSKSNNDLVAFYSCLAWLCIRQQIDAPAQVDDKDAANGVKPKAEYHKMATEFANQAFILDRSWSVNILARGELMLAVGNYDEALQPFQTVLKQSSDSNLFALTGKARVLYHKKNYRGALQLYQRILFGRPDFKPDPRIGIGLCFWKLKDQEGALQAWERALELNPQNEAVNTLLGIYYITLALENPGSDDFAQNYAQGLGFVQAAYKKNPNYSASGILLSSYLYSKKNADAVIKLTQRAVKNSDVPSVIGDAYFWMGRAYHFMEDYDTALKYYTLAEEKSKGSSLSALIGKGLVQVAQDSPEALLTFESAVNSFPKSLEALLLLGLLTALRAGTDSKRVARAITLLERYLAVSKEKDEIPSSQALITLSTLYEDSNIDKAEIYLSDALQQFGGEDDETLRKDVEKALLYNNIGTFQYFRGSYEESEQSFEKAKSLLSESANQEDNDALITVTFNLARLYDAWGQPEKAIDLYHTVLESAPHYSDASVRLSYLSIVLNKEDATDSLKAIMGESDDNLEVRALYGWWLRRQKRSAAKNINEDIEQRHYKHSLVDINKHDAYSLVAMGNLYLVAAREMRASKPGDQEKKDKLYFKASEFFDKALQIDFHNAYAAQGIAIIFAETKQAELALHIFSKIRETINDITIYINLGHCLAELRQFVKAIEAYEYALEKFRGGPNDGQLMTLLGRAWYARGLSDKNLASYRTALDYSKKALDKSPDNPGLKFNVAFVQFQLADFVRKLPLTNRSVDDIEEAIPALEDAISSMNDLAKVKYPPFPPSELEQRALMGQNTLRKQLDRALAEQLEYEELNKTKISNARKLREEEQKRRIEEEEAKKKAEVEKQAMLAEERRKLQEEAMQWTEESRMAAEEEAENVRRATEEKKEARKTRSSETRERSKQKKSSRGKGQKEGRDESERSSSKKFKSDEFIADSDEEDDGGYNSQQSSGDEDEGLFGEENDEQDGSDGEKKRKSDEDGEEGIAKKRRTNRIEDDEEDDYDAEPNGGAKEPKKRSNVIDDDDDEDMEG